MGKPGAESSDQTSISHFSHPHPLQLLNLQTLGQTLQCSACKLDASVSVYTCTTCNFFLHPKCFQLPQQIKHPFDQDHTLILHPKPVYPEGLFRCDACGYQSDSFSYHCSPCGIDLHTTCASLPIKFTHQCHHHPLSLTFSAPYPGNSFSCDICRRVSAKTWIYRCANCEFDVHLNCVATVVPAPLTQQPRTVGTRSVLPGHVMNSPIMGSYGATRPPQPSVMGQQSNSSIPNSIPSPVPTTYTGSPIMGAYSVPRPSQPSVMGQQLNSSISNSVPSPVPTTYAGMPTQTNSMIYNNVNQPGYGAARPVNGLRDQLMFAAVNGIASGVAESTTSAILQGFFGGEDGGGGDVCHVDVVGMEGGGAAADGGSYYDGMDGGGDGSYWIH